MSFFPTFYKGTVSRDLWEQVRRVDPGQTARGGQTVMGWERRGPYTYYIRKQTMHGRTVRTSYGRGQAAEIAAAEDAERRQVQETTQAEQARLAQLDQQLEEVSQRIALLMQASLCVADYHQHHR